MTRRTTLVSLSLVGVVAVAAACSSAPDEGATSTSDIVSGVPADAPAWRRSWDQPMSGAQVSDVAAS